MKEKEQEDWNPRDSAVTEDQRRAYDDMRQRCPVAHSEFLGWSLFLHEDVADVLADPETYSNVTQFPAIPNGMDPPDHGRYRKALDALYGQDQMDRLEQSARQIAASLLGSLLASGEVEFIKDFGTPFSLKALCAALGWPEQQWECLGGWAHDSQLDAFDRVPGAGQALASLFSGHVKANLELHRGSRRQTADVTDALLATEVDGVRLDDDEIVAILRNWTAGHGTVVAGLGIVVMHLGMDPKLQNQLRKDPSLIPAAIEEILRVDGPLVANPRTTTRAVEIRGRKIPKGDRLTLMWIAANRDQHAFDNPDAINIKRGGDKSMVWGRGIHLCQGASMARLEMRVALEELLAKTQQFECTDDDQHRAVYPSNGLAKLSLRIN